MASVSSVRLRRLNDSADSPDLNACARDREGWDQGRQHGCRLRAPLEDRSLAGVIENIAHPLLVVFAPAGLSAAASERIIGLTTIATGKGFLIAYADYVRTSISAIEDLSAIPSLAAKK